MQINPQVVAARLRSRSSRREWFAVRGPINRGPAPVWSSEAEVLRALGEDRPSTRGSPSGAPEQPELPLQRPRF
jgi:hypothetical protein